MAKKKQTLTNLRGISREDYVKSLTETEREELQDFIKQYPYIWKHFQDDDPSEMGKEFLPLDFFRLYTEVKGLIEACKDRPLDAIEHLSTFSLSPAQWLTLWDITRGEFGGREDTALCLTEVSDFVLSRTGEDDFFDYDHEEWKKLERFDFDRVLTHIQGFQDLRERIAYLLELKTEWQRENHNTWHHPREMTFAQMCDLEINKYQKLLRLERSEVKTSTDEIPSAPEFKPRKGGKKAEDELSASRAILLVFALHPELVNVDGNKLAKVIAFLSGGTLEEGTISKMRSNLKPDANGHFKKGGFEEDKEIVRGFLRLLDMHDEAGSLEDILRGDY